jgi:hypothetical protein
MAATVAAGKVDSGDFALDAPYGHNSSAFYGDLAVRMFGRTGKIPRDQVDKHMYRSSYLVGEICR